MSWDNLPGSSPLFDILWAKAQFDADGGLAPDGPEVRIWLTEGDPGNQGLVRRAVEGGKDLQ